MQIISSLKAFIYAPAQLTDTSSPLPFTANDLNSALRHGETQTIRGYGELLQQVLPYLLKNDPTKLVELLAAKNYRGILGLCMAVQEDHADTVKAYGELLQHIFQPLPRNQFVILFDVYDALKESIKNVLLEWLEDYDGKTTELISTCHKEAYQKLNQPEEKMLIPTEPDANELINAADFLQKNDYQNAYTRYEALMQKGSTEATFQLGLMMLNVQNDHYDESKAITLLQLAHDLGHNKAALTIGNFYLNQGEKFIPLAKQWYEIALKRNNPSDVLTACVRLGQMHLKLFQQDQQSASLAEARKWYQKAVDVVKPGAETADYAEALFQLAKTTIDHPGFFGLSTEEKTLLVTQLEEAHNSGHKKAAYELARWYETRFTWPHEKTANDKLIRYWYGKASEVGLIRRSC